MPPILENPKTSAHLPVSKAGTDVDENHARAPWKCLVMCERIGPYHYARLSAFSSQANVIALEVFGMDSTYAWEKVADTTEFEWRTLMEGPNSVGTGSQMYTLISQTLDDISPDVVAIPGWIGVGPISALRWCSKRKVPAVIMSASSAIGKNRHGWREVCKRHIVRHFSAGLGGGTPQVEYLADLGLPADRVFSGGNVVDNDFFYHRSQVARRNSSQLRLQYDLPDDYFLCVCRFIEEKNLDILLRAFANYRKQSGSKAWKLVLMGDGPLRARILDLRDQLELGDTLVLPGFKQLNELPVYYGLAKAFVLPSLSETWGLVTNEAMASGLPVLISSHCGCARDLVKDGHNGFTFHPEDAEQLTNLMSKMTLDEWHLNAMGQASREIIARWTPATFANSLRKAAGVAIAKPLLRRRIFDPLLLQAAMIK